MTYYYFNQSKPLEVQELQKIRKKCLATTLADYQRPSYSRTELNCYTATEIR